MFFRKSLQETRYFKTFSLPEITTMDLKKLKQTALFISLVLGLLSSNVMAQTDLTPTEVNVASSCLCDLTANACDVNCFCDPDCSEEDKSAFDEQELTRINDDNACVRKDLILTDNSDYVATKNTNEDLLCLWKDNFDERNFYRSVANVENANEFDSYLNTYSSQVTAVEPDIAPTQYEPYKYNSPIYVVRRLDSTDDATNATVSEFVVGHLQAIGPSVFSAKCSDSNQIRYLVELEENCESVTQVSETSCASTPSFDVTNFVSGFNVFNNTEIFLQEADGLPDLVGIYDSLLSIQWCTIQGVDAACEPQNDTALFKPAYDITSQTCSNVVTAVAYKLVYENGTILTQVSADVTLTNFSLSSSSSDGLPFNFRTTVSFTQDPEANTVERSGNPGYIRGKPVRKGYLNVASDVFTIQTPDLEDQFLSVITPSASDNSCLAAASRAKTAVGFGLNTISGCHVEATQASFNSTESCQTLQDEIRIALLSGSDFTQAQGNDPKDALTGETTDNDQDPNLYLARFGNTDASLPGNWIEVFFDTIPPAAKSGFGCNLVTRVKLDILFANVGKLESPQAKIIGAKYSFPQSTVAYKCGPVCQANGGTQKIPARVTVNFVDVSETSQGAVKKIPPIKTDIPYDFFYPFLLDSSSPLSSTFPKLILLVSSILSHLLKML